MNSSLNKWNIVCDVIDFLLPKNIKIILPSFDHLVQEMMPYYDFDKGTTPEFVTKLNETIIDYLI